MSDLRPLTLDDVQRAGAVLGRAFGDNPGYLRLLDFLGDDERRAAVIRIKTGFTNAAVRHQEAEGLWVDGRLVAASLVSAPGQHPPSPMAKLRQARGCVTTGLRGVRNFLRADAYMAKHHPHESHYYLFVLGVEPSEQGKGHGRALLQALNARADARHLPCYLETDKESSVRLYQSVGYELRTDETIGGLNGLRLWTMMRPAG